MQDSAGNDSFLSKWCRPWWRRQVNRIKLVHYPTYLPTLDDLFARGVSTTPRVVPGAIRGGRNI